MKRKLSKICTLCTQNLTLLCLLILTANTAAAKNNASASQTLPPEHVIASSATIPAKVVDGDSLEIGATRIRLTGIDAPEYDQTCKTADNKLYLCGQTSADYLQNLINNKTVTCMEHTKDRYDRSLCTCYAGNTDLNAEMIRSGNAIVYLESPYAGQQEIARTQKNGIWSGNFMHPRLFRLLKSHKEAKSGN